MRSFVKSPEGATAVAEAPAPTPTETSTAEQQAAPAPEAPHAVARRSTSGPYVGGEISSSDLKMPFLSCVQAVGPKSVLYSPGTLLLGDVEVTKAPAPQQPTPRLRVLFCSVNKTYVENLPYNPAPGSPRPRMFNSAADVVAAGGNLDWRGNTPPSYMPKLTGLTLVRQPEALDDPQFSLIVGDKTYAPAMVSFQKTSYSAAKTLLTDLSLSLKNNPTATFYDLFWAREQKGQNWVWVAKLVRVRDEKPSEELQAMAIKMSGSQVAIEDDTEA